MAEGPEATATEAFTVREPAHLRAPAVFASPHSGQHYPDTLFRDSRLKRDQLRRAEDSFVDEIFAAAPALGVPLLSATHARIWLDVNREPYELDPAMFADRLPAYANTTSLRVAAGLGTVPRLVGDGFEIYRRKLRVTEAEARIRGLYRPYHGALRGLLNRAMTVFGHAVLIDCHSMPSRPLPNGRDEPDGRADIVLGNRFGTTCAEELIDAVEQTWRQLGYRVARNVPYAGGFSTYHYGQPREGLHSLQIEINRAVYMEETRYRKRSDFDLVVADATRVIDTVIALDLGLPLAAQ